MDVQLPDDRRSRRLEDPADDDVDASAVAAPTEVVAALPPPPPSSSSSYTPSGGENNNTGSNAIANSSFVNSTVAAGGTKETAAAVVSPAKQTTSAPAASGGGEGELADEDGDGLTPAQLPAYEELEEEAMEDEEIYEDIEEVQGGISALEADRDNATDPIVAAGIETEIEDLEAVEGELLEEALEGGLDEAFGFDDDAAVFIGNNNGTSGVGGGDGDDEIASERGDDYSPPDAETLEEEIDEIEEEIKGRCCPFLLLFLLCLT